MIVKRLNESVLVMADRFSELAVTIEQALNIGFDIFYTQRFPDESLTDYRKRLGEMGYLDEPEQRWMYQKAVYRAIWDKFSIWRR